MESQSVKLVAIYLISQSLTGVARMQCIRLNHETETKCFPMCLFPETDCYSPGEERRMAGTVPVLCPNMRLHAPSLAAMLFSSPCQPSLYGATFFLLLLPSYRRVKINRLQH
jgi:hypothetical protein